MEDEDFGDWNAFKAALTLEPTLEAILPNVVDQDTFAANEEEISVEVANDTSVIDLGGEVPVSADSRKGADNVVDTSNSTPRSISIIHTADPDQSVNVTSQHIITPESVLQSQTEFPSNGFDLLSTNNNAEAPERETGRNILEMRTGAHGVTDPVDDPFADIDSPVAPFMMTDAMSESNNPANCAVNRESASVDILVHNNAHEGLITSEANLDSVVEDPFATIIDSSADPAMIMVDTVNESNGVVRSSSTTPGAVAANNKDQSQCTMKDRENSGLSNTDHETMTIVPSTIIDNFVPTLSENELDVDSIIDITEPVASASGNADDPFDSIDLPIEPVIAMMTDSSSEIKAISKHIISTVTSKVEAEESVFSVKQAQADSTKDNSSSSVEFASVDDVSTTSAMIVDTVDNDIKGMARSSIINAVCQNKETDSSINNVEHNQDHFEADKGLKLPLSEVVDEAMTTIGPSTMTDAAISEHDPVADQVVQDLNHDQVSKQSDNFRTADPFLSDVESTLEPSIGIEQVGSTAIQETLMIDDASFELAHQPLIVMNEDAASGAIAASIVLTSNEVDKHQLCNDVLMNKDVSGKVHHEFVEELSRNGDNVNEPDLHPSPDSSSTKAFVDVNADATTDFAAGDSVVDNKEDNTHVESLRTVENEVIEEQNIDTEGHVEPGVFTVAILEQSENEDFAAGSPLAVTEAQEQQSLPVQINEIAVVESAAVEGEEDDDWDDFAGPTATIAPVEPSTEVAHEPVASVDVQPSNVGDDGDDDDWDDFAGPTTDVEPKRETSESLALAHHNDMGPSGPVPSTVEPCIGASVVSSFSGFSSAERDYVVHPLVFKPTLLASSSNTRRRQGRRATNDSLQTAAQSLQTFVSSERLVTAIRRFLPTDALDDKALQDRLDQLRPTSMIFVTSQRNSLNLQSSLTAAATFEDNVGNNSHSVVVEDMTAAESFLQSLPDLSYLLVQIPEQ